VVAIRRSTLAAPRPPQIPATKGRARCGSDGLKVALHSCVQRRRFYVSAGSTPICGIGYTGMRGLLHSVAVAVAVSGLGLAGLGVAGHAQARPGPVPERLCPFRSVLDDVGANDDCDPFDDNAQDNNTPGPPNLCGLGGAWAGNDQLCPPPTVDINVNHGGEVTHNDNIHINDDGNHPMPPP
jgi:hypothetical protein